MAAIENYIWEWSDYRSDRSEVVPYTDIQAPDVVRDMNERAFGHGQHGGQDGVELKEWVYGENASFWLAKTAEPGSGDIGQPIHEALIPRLCGVVGLDANDVALGHRHYMGRMGRTVPGEARPTSYHRYRPGNTRDLAGPISPGSRFFQDYAAMAVLDLIIGNADRHPKNYMVDTTGNLFVIDNGRALGRGVLQSVLQETTLEALANSGGREGRPWPHEFFSNLATRFQSLPAAVDVAFASLPRSWRRLHDLAVASTPADFQADRLERKADVVKRNAAAALAWLLRKAV